jgi:subtilisin family serine protease
MCDCVPGRVVVIHDREDGTGREVVDLVRDEQFPGVRYAASMDELTHAAGRGSQGRHALHLLEVEPGLEMWSAANLQFRYQTAFVRRLETGDISPGDYRYSAFTDPGGHLMAAPDSAIGLAQVPAPGFRFDPAHTAYKNLMNLSGSRETGVGIRVAVVDSGLDARSGLSASTSSRSFHDDRTTSSIDDTNGHGTAVASVIHDLAPDAELTILKIGNENPMSEWNLIAAMLTGANADLINLSLAFSLNAHDCQYCGRTENHSARSEVFERVIDEILIMNPELIVVAAAGNGTRQRVDFPARFASVVAVGAIDSQKNVAPYSNTGAVDHMGQAHSRLYFAPGGGNGERIGTTVTPTGQQIDHDGTSFAAPYVSALIALQLQAAGASWPGRADAVLAHFRRNSDTSINGYSQQTHGNGLIRL